MDNKRLNDLCKRLAVGEQSYYARQKSALEGFLRLANDDGSSKQAAQGWLDDLETYVASEYNRLVRENGSDVFQIETAAFFLTNLCENYFGRQMNSMGEYQKSVRPAEPIKASETVKMMRTLDHAFLPVFSALQDYYEKKEPLTALIICTGKFKILTRIADDSLYLSCFY